MPLRATNGLDATGSPVAVGSQAGLEIYLDDCHSSATVGDQAAIFLGIDNGEDQPTRNEFIRMQTHGGVVDSILYLTNCQHTNLVEIDGTMTTSCFAGSAGSSAGRLLL